jgi:integrase
VSLLIAQGEHPKVIADRLGHTSVRTVLDVYGHLYEGADEAAAERLDAQITSLPPTIMRHARIDEQPGAHRHILTI